MEQDLIRPTAHDPLLEDSRAFWRELGKGMIRESIGTIDETARQIIGVAGILEGLYFHAIAFTDLQGKLTGRAMWVYLAPVLLLLISLVSALLVFFPDRYRLNFNSSEASKRVYERVVSSKLLALRVGSFFLALGIIALFFAVLTYLRGP